jgi:drug/metabolite transporter (DMT)-like permease
MNFFWAAVYSAYKVIGPSVPTGAIVTLRFGLAALCLLFVWPWLPGPAPRGRDLAITCLMGVMLFVVGQRLQVYGNFLGRAGDSSVLMAFEPVITSVAAGLFLREYIGPRRWAGFGFGLIGVGLLHGAWRSDFHWAGLGASLIFISSFVCEAAYSVIGKGIVMRSSVMKMLAISLSAGTCANLLVDGRSTLSAACSLSFQAWLLLLIMATICTALGYSIWFLIIRECPVNVVALTVFAQSIFGVALAALWLHEALNWGQLFGCLVIVTGLIIGLSRQVHTHPEPAT